MGGAGKIVLTAPYELYKETHPELGEGQYLFLFDTFDHSLAPIISSSGKYHAFLGMSPGGKFVTFTSADSSDFGTVWINLLNVYNGQVIDVVKFENEDYGLGFCDFAFCSRDQLFAWLSDDIFAYVAPDANRVNRIFLYDPSSGEAKAITPDDKSVDDGFSVVSPEGPFFWRTSSGNYQTLISGETDEIDVRISQESAPKGWGRWIFQDYSVGSVGADNFFRLSSFEDTDPNLVENLLASYFEEGFPPNFGVNILAWSSDQTKALIETYVIDQATSSYHQWFVWDILFGSLVKLQIDVTEGIGNHTFWSQDDKKILVVTFPVEGEQRKPLYQEATLRMFSPEDGSLINSISAPWAYMNLSFSPDGTQFLSTSLASEPVVVDLTTLYVTPLLLPDSWIDYYRDPDQPFQKWNSLEAVWISK